MKPWSSPVRPFERLIKEYVDAPTPPPAGWETYDLGKLAFSAPPGLTRAPGRGIDSVAGKYVGDHLNISFDYGPHTAGIECLSRANIVIDGVDARLEFTGDRVPGSAEQTIHLQSTRILGQGLRFTIALPAGAMDSGDDALRDAVTIVQSIKFKFDDVWYRER